MLVGLEYGKRAVRYRSVTFRGGMQELKKSILDRFHDLTGINELELDQLIIHLKSEEFGGEFEEVEVDSDIPDKSVLKAVVEDVS